MDKIPGVKCNEKGFGPLELSSNLQGAVDATTSVANGNNSTGQKVVGGVSGVYKMIPFFATDMTKKPTKGQYILGKADIAPNLKICYLESKYKDKDGNTQTNGNTQTKKIPYPVRKTKDYAVSGGSNSKGATNTGSGNQTGTTYNYE